MIDRASPGKVIGMWLYWQPCGLFSCLFLSRRETGHKMWSMYVHFKGAVTSPLELSTGRPGIMAGSRVALSLATLNHYIFTHHQECNPSRNDWIMKQALRGVLSVESKTLAPDSLAQTTHSRSLRKVSNLSLAFKQTSPKV